MVSKIHHVGIVVRAIRSAYGFWRDVLGLPLVREGELPDQGVRVALLAAGDSEVELLEPSRPGTGVARFLEKRGEGLHHVCFSTGDVAGELASLGARGVRLIDAVPRAGLAGAIGFIHPAACHNVLVELATPQSDQPGPETPVRLKRVVIGSTEPHATAKTFQGLFGLPEVAINGGARAMLGWTGGGTLLMVPAGEVGGQDGLVALSMVAPELPPLVERLEAARATMLVGASELTIEPQSSHGVHLHISRYHFP